MNLIQTNNPKKLKLNELLDQQNQLFVLKQFKFYAKNYNTIYILIQLSSCKLIRNLIQNELSQSDNYLSSLIYQIKILKQPDLSKFHDY